MSNSTSTQPPADAGSGSDAATAVGGAVIGLALVCVILRFYTRIFTRAGLWWDDYLLLLSMVFTIVTAALLLWSNSFDPNGQAVAVNTDPNYQYTPEDHLYLKVTFATSVLYFAIICTTKLGILAMYNRLFSIRHLNSVRFQVGILSGIVVAYWIGCTVANLTNCVPLKWTWLNSLDDPRYCFNFNYFWVAAGAVEVLLDVLILALPLRAVSKLQMSTRLKFELTGIFLLGGFVVVTGLVKTITGYAPGLREPNYNKTEAWTTVHAGMAIVCACLPIYRPLLRKVANSVPIRRCAKVLGFSTVASQSRTERGTEGSHFKYSHTRSNTTDSTKRVSWANRLSAIFTPPGERAYMPTARQGSGSQGSELGELSPDEAKVACAADATEVPEDDSPNSPWPQNSWLYRPSRPPRRTRAEIEGESMQPPTERALV